VTVLDRDPLAVDADELGRARVLLTVVEGRVVAEASMENAGRMVVS
jgi:predicted amidohydrolase YtcJ